MVRFVSFHFDKDNEIFKDLFLIGIITEHTQWNMDRDARMHFGVFFFI